MAEEWLAISDVDKDNVLTVNEARSGIAKWAQKELGFKHGTPIFHDLFLKIDDKYCKRKPPTMNVDELLGHMKRCMSDIQKLAKV